MESILAFIDHLLMGNGIIISVATYVIAEIIKSIAPGLKRFIPLVGASLGILLALIVPNLFPDTDIVSTVIIGMTLGWSSTGVYETIKGVTRS